MRRGIAGRRGARKHVAEPGCGPTGAAEPRRADMAELIHPQGGPSIQPSTIQRMFPTRSAYYARLRSIRPRREMTRRITCCREQMKRTIV